MVKSVNSYAPLFQLDRDRSTLPLQEQIRRRMISLITEDIFVLGQKLPSSRKLARELGISRTTVNTAYQMLISDGHLEARPRSGIFVAHKISQLRDRKLNSVDAESRPPLPDATHLSDKLVNNIRNVSDRFQIPPDWQNYQFSFLDERFDQSLFPLDGWREASRYALSKKEIADWSSDKVQVDDEILITEIRTKLLARRGISVKPNEILVTEGQQQALFLISLAFINKNRRIGIEVPSRPELSELVQLFGTSPTGLNVDEDGLQITNDLDDCDLVYVSPSRQPPSGVTMSLARRHKLLQCASDRDFLVIEDDFGCEMNFLENALPALYSLDQSQRVIHVGALSQVLLPGASIGFIVAPANIISNIRRLRNLTVRRPTAHAQRVTGHFIALGHYDSLVRHLNRTFAERLVVLRDALNHYLPTAVLLAPAKGGTAYWVQGPENLNADLLARAAEARGLLIELATSWYTHKDAQKNMFRLSVTSIPAEKIRQGIALLAELIQDLCEPVTRKTEYGSKDWLNASALKEAMTGTTLHMKTIDGDPCTVIMEKSGKMLGIAGYAHEDRDQGRWWLVDDKWFRQWDNWAFGETLGFHVVIKDHILIWVDESGREIDRATISSRN